MYFDLGPTNPNTACCIVGIVINWDAAMGEILGEILNHRWGVFGKSMCTNVLCCEIYDKVTKTPDPTGSYKQN